MSPAPNLWERPFHMRAVLVAERARKGARSTLRGLGVAPATAEAPTSNSNWDAIAAATLRRHGLSNLAEVTQRNRSPILAPVMFELCYMLRRYGRRADGVPFTDGQIARLLGRDRSSIIKGAKRY